MTKQQDKGHEILDNIKAEVSKVVIGKDDIKELLMVALLSQGHVLIEGLPGTAKTTVARTFARVIGGTFKRVQGTPDMLPADILGFYLYHPDASSTFMPGPIFANVVLVDELNRTTPRTQAALLEAMQEQQVTIERETHHLEQPYIVIASQIPYGGVGTAPLSEVQIDRFMFRIWSAYPTIDEEVKILQDIDTILEPSISAVATPEAIIKLQQEVKKVYISGNIQRYIIRLIDGLRNYPDVSPGPSPRGGIALFRGARALAFIQGRDFVIPDDVKQLLIPVISHRLRITAEAEMENVTPEVIINRVAADVPIPREGVVTDTGAAAEDSAGTADLITAVTSEEAGAVTEAEELVSDSDTRLGTLDEDSVVANEVISVEPEEIRDKTREASELIKWLPLKAFKEWEWIIIIFALVLAAVMISVGLLSIR